MPVTVKIEQKSAHGAPIRTDLADFEAPGTRAEGIKTFWIWMLFMFVFAGGLGASSVTREIGIGIFVWTLASVIAYFFVAPRALLRRLRLHGADIILTAQNAPRLKTTLTKGSALLKIPLPEAFLLDEEIPQIRISGVAPPYFLVLTQASCRLLQPAELDCLVVRAMIHARQGNVRRLTVLRLMNDTQPALRFLAWPVMFYCFLLRHWWQDLAEQTADRLTLLLVKNPKLLLSATLKLHAATDPVMLEEGITPDDVDNYVRMGNTIGLEGKEISTHYRLGQAIHENLYLESRLQALDLWAKSTDYKEAVERLAEARASHVAHPAPTG